MDERDPAERPRRRTFTVEYKERIVAEYDSLAVGSSERGALLRREFFACYSVGDDRLWGRIEPAKGWKPTLRALRSIRAYLDDGEPIYVILYNLNHHRGQTIRDWCEANAVELVFTPTYASWANPIEAHFGPLRQFVLANSDHADHPALGRALRAYLRWRNTHTRHPQLLEHQCRHRARIRSEQQRRWGHPKPQAA